ncbi:LysR family transcriptional regulator [Sulfitobacter sp. S190]|uniref:LysR family transcriptional regulator n=1 Tax=Sulfitobacter sp. S190 TaxID=2867022 RepID=UPI0021A7DB3E|nr:LysR family transcriptional regulator [Sulfitobacter sp. S190]UWR21756.1 LysR family transcriptional regulator [Sulfitobacter sp. S190]
MDDDELFLAVLDGGSFRAAAKAAGLDPSRVSRRIAALEARVGVKLLNRTTRACAPTETGTRYGEGIRRLTDARAALLAEVTGGQDVPKGRLRVAAPTDFGARFVAPVLTKMSETYAELSVDLRLGSGFADLLAEGIDVAIRIGNLSDSALMARRIGISQRVLVAAPAIAAAVRTPADLGDISIVSYRTGMTEMRTSFEQGGVRQDLRMPCRYAVNSMTAVRDAVLAGRGAHLGPVWAFRDDLAQGDLVALLPDARFDPFPIHAVWSPTPYQPAASRIFVTLMAEHLTKAGLSQA